MKLPFKLSKLLSKPCNKLKFRKLRRKPLFITRLVTKLLKKTSPNKFVSILQKLRPRRPSPDHNKEMEDRVEEMKSFSDYASHHDQQRAPFPSPLTPAYIRKEEEEEDACTSFENYLVEMIVEEGKMRDLVDVEDVLHCWNHLRSPVFVDLVCRFYTELCTDLFSSHTTPSIITNTSFT